MAGKNGRSKRGETADRFGADKHGLLEKVSHDLRNELGGIVFMAGHLAGGVTDDAVGRKVFKSATSIKRMALRMGGLVEELLDIAGFEVDSLVERAVARPATATEGARRLPGELRRAAR